MAVRNDRPKKYNKFTGERIDENFEFYTSIEFKNRKPDEQLKTLLWNSCSVCTPKKVKSIIEDIQNTQQG